FRSDLWHYFFDRVNGMLQSRGLYLSGWEEIGMKKAVVNGRRKMVVEPRFAGENFHTDVWNNLGDNVDLAYRLANTGYQVVLTNVTNFYIDLAYNIASMSRGSTGVDTWIWKSRLGSFRTTITAV